jgi:hypothetical protein
MTDDEDNMLDEVFQFPEHERLTRWEQDRVKEWSEQREERGAQFFLSPKQWVIVRKMHEKIYGT